jgi:hypothetical protein
MTQTAPTQTNQSPTRPEHVKALATAAELLAYIEPFEAVACDFGGVSGAYIRALRQNPQADSMIYRGVLFDLPQLPRAILLLTQLAKPVHGNMDLRTLRPAAELIVHHRLSHLRLVSPSTWTAHVEVSQNGETWRRLAPQPVTTAEPEEVAADAAE